jgi:hypothetical protein
MTGVEAAMLCGVIALPVIGAWVGWSWARWAYRKPRHHHDWGKWYEIPANYLVFGRKVSETVMQERQCATCGLRQTN